jgi:uncharacterized protein
MMDQEVVVITGAGSGLGASLAKKYSEMGAYVCLLGRNEARLKNTANLLHNNYSIYQLDVSVKGEVDKVFQAIYQEVGPIDLLINNAGTGSFALAEQIDEKSVHDMIDVNLKGTIFCSQVVLPDMKQRNKGIIANIVSTAGLEGKVTESVYCASKFGVKGFTESLLAELKDTSVKVYGAYMGGMKTEFWSGIYSEEQTQNLMEPDDVADIIIDNLKPRRNMFVPQVVIKNKF